MARNKGHIAGFEEVSGDDVNNNANSNENSNENNNDAASDPLDRIINKKKKKDDTHTLKGIYFENDVARALDKIKSSGGKGIQSEVVNDIVKKALKEKGFM